jgi:hypothetical protein
MAETKRPREIEIQDPLSEVTRAERKTLLGVSAAGLIIVKTGLVPSEISALGIKFERADQHTLLTLLSAVVIYFLIAFLIYAASDFVAWRVSLTYAIRTAILNDIRQTRPEREIEDNIREQFSDIGRLWVAATRPMSVVRAIFEFLVPIMIALYTVHALWTTPPPEPPSQSKPPISAPAPLPKAPDSKTQPKP